MKPRSSFIQAFDQLPQTLPIYTLENALLPGGELPLELAEPGDLALFFNALKTDQLVGMIQPQCKDTELKTYQNTYQTGCAGRIRQYRERKDGRLNVMLTGVCRYQIVDLMHHKEGYRSASVDWQGFKNDYQSEAVEATLIESFKKKLHIYFARHNMQVDWEVLDKLPIEQVVNNLVLVLKLDIDSKQHLLESPTVSDRLTLFSELTSKNVLPFLAPNRKSPYAPR